MAAERRAGRVCFAQVEEESYSPLAACRTGDSAPSMGAIFGVRVPGRAGHSEASEAQLREGDRAWGGSVERNREPMNKNRIRGVADQGEQAVNCKALVAKGQAA